MSAYEKPTQDLAIFDPLAFTQNNTPLTIESGSKYFLRFPNAQGTENFNTLSANEITAPGDLFLNPVGSVDMNGKTLNMTNGEIHNCPLIHSKNNEDIIIEGKGTGKVILKTSNSDAVSVLPSKITLQKDLEVESSTTNVKVYNVNFKDLLDGTNNSNLYQFDNEFKFQNISNSGIIDFITNDALGAQTTVLEASSTSVIMRKPLNMSNNAIINCPLIQASNDEDIVIEGKGSGNVILKNVTKIMEIQNHSIRCYQDLYMYQVDNNEPPPLLKAYQIFIQNLTPNGAQSTLFHNGLILKLENDSLGGSINLVTNDALGAQTTVLEASSTSVIIRKPLDMSNNSITGCTLFQSPANSNIRIDAQGAGSDITLRADLLDTLKIGPTGVQPYKQIFMSATNFIDRSIYSGALFLQNNVNGGEVGRLSMDASLVLVENRANLGNIIFQTRDATSATTNVLEVSSAAVIIKRPITLNDASSANRGINSSVFNFNEVTGDYNPTVLHQIYQTGGTTNHINYVNSGIINFSVINAGSTLVTPLQITSTANNIASNINLAMAAGTGVINQMITTGSLSTNTLKKTAVIINSGSTIGSATAGLEIFDEGTALGRGLLILPNSGGGSYSTFNMANDCALISRSPQNNNAISITNWNSDMRNGIRIATSDVSNCSVSIQNGSGTAFSEFRMAFNRTLNTFTTTYNNPIDFNPGTISPARRLLSGLGTLSFTDILGNTTGGTDTGTIFNNSLATVPGMQYISNLNTGSHNFIVSDASFKYNPFSVNFQNIRKNVITVLADFDNGNSLTVAGGLITASISNVNVASSASPRTLGSYTIVSRGTYMVVANFKLVTVGSNATVNKFMCGTVNVALTFNTAGQYSTGTVNVDNTVAYIHPAIYQTVSTQMITISNPNSPIYFTYIIDFLGPATQMGISMTYSITRIA